MTEYLTAILKAAAPQRFSDTWQYEINTRKLPFKQWVWSSNLQRVTIKSSRNLLVPGFSVYQHLLAEGKQNSNMLTCL